MNTCLRHMVSYPQGGYCDRCGPPRYELVTTSNTPNVAPCTCATMWTLRPGQQIITTCPRHGTVVYSNPMRVF